MTNSFYQHTDTFLVSVDCVILGFKDNELNVLLTTRKIAPCKGDHSLMGGFVFSNESVNQAATRVLTECTGIKDLYMEQVGTYGEVTRDAGARVISVAYYALVDMDFFDDSVLDLYHSQWYSLNNLPFLIFDHKQMIQEALVILRQKTATTPISFHLLQNKFTLPQLQSLIETIFQHTVDKRNFRKKILSMEILNKQEIKDKKSSKRGAFYYIFDEEKYNEMRRNGFYFSI